MRLIDADRLEHFIQEQAKKYGWFTNEFSCEYIIGLIENAPTIEAEPIRHGHWVFDYFEEIIQEHIYHCSICGSESFSETNYCGNCGAKMDEEAEND